MLTLLFLLGVSTGAFATLVGIGGEFIFVPVFVMAIHYSPQHAIGTSLAIVFFNALPSTFTYIKQKEIYYKTAIPCSLATLPGAMLGSYLAYYFSNHSFHISFGLLLIILAILLNLRLKTDLSADFALTILRYNRKLGIALSVMIGFISSTLGIGSVINYIPVMMALLGLPTHTAIATSHFILTMSAFFGAISHYLLGNILTTPALTIGSGTVLGAGLGAYIAPQTESRSVTLLLCIALLILGLRMMFS